MTPRRWALLALALVGAGAALVWQAADAPLAAPGTDAGPMAVVDTVEHCITIRASYLQALAPLQVCERDEDCIAERRDGVVSGLDGCARYLRADAGTGTTVDPLQAAWLARGCARDYRTCAPRHARCVQSACVERPPPEVPPTWKRFEHRSTRTPGRGFAMFVPPDYGDVDRVREDGEGGRFEGDRLSYEFDEYAAFREAATEEGEVGLAREEHRVNGHDAVFQTIRLKDRRIFSSVHIALTGPDAGRRLALTLFAVCSTVEVCSDVWTIGRSIEID